jgi:hypothetical protein
MGNQFCCVSQYENDIQTTKIITQIMSYKNQNNFFTLFLYNIEENKSKKININLRILNSLKGLSQINKGEGIIYLCGNNEIISPTLVSGSYLFKLEIIDEKVETQILITSRFYHYNPSLLIYNQSIFVIGGKKQEKCELYNFELNKWKEVRNLPEERYKCSLIIDRNEEYLYLFGGISYKNNKIEGNNTILRLVVKNILYQWERIMINENYNLLNRFSSACFKINNSNFIYILGGKNVDEVKNNNNLVNNVVIYDCFCRIVKEANFKLKKECCFINKSAMRVNTQQYCFIDKDCNIHLIDFSTKNSEIIYLNTEDNKDEIVQKINI